MEILRHVRNEGPIQTFTTPWIADLTRGFKRLVELVLTPVLVLSAQITTVSVGDVPINLPAPAGFHEISALSPDTRKTFELLTPPANRLLAVFVSEADLGRILRRDSPELLRYMLIQTYQEVEGAKFRQVEFEQLAGLAKRQHETMFRKAKDQIQSLMTEHAEEFPWGDPTSLGLTLGEQVPLGVFLDKKDALGFARIGRYHMSLAGRKIDRVTAYTISFLNVENKLLFMYVYARYDDQETLKWIRMTTTTWVDQILNGNDPAHQSVPGPNQMPRNRSHVWSRIVNKAITGAIGGVLLSIAVMGIQLLRKLTESKKTRV